MLSLLCILVILTDTLFRRIPNGVVVAFIALQLTQLGLGIEWAVGPAAASSWTVALIGLAVPLLILPLFWLRGLMGAGDVKLIAALGFCLGLQHLGPAWLIASLLAGVHSVVQICLVRSRPAALASGAHAPAQPSLWFVLGNASERLPSWVRRRRQHRQGAPYGAYLALATLLWLAWNDALISR